MLSEQASARQQTDLSVDADPHKLASLHFHEATEYWLISRFAP